MLSKPIKMLISSFKLELGTIITPIGYSIWTNNWFAEMFFGSYNTLPVAALKRLFQMFFDSRSEGDQNEESTVAAWTIKLIGNSSYGHQIMDRSRYTNTNNVKGSQMDNFINNWFFKSLNEMPGQIYELEMRKTHIKHKKPTFFRFFSSITPNLQCCNKYNFFFSFCDPNKYKMIEMDIDNLYMARSDDKLDKIIRPEMQPLWCLMRHSDCAYNFAANSFAAISSLEIVTKSMLLLIKEHLVLLWMNFGVSMLLLFAEKRTAATMWKQTEQSYPVKKSTRTALWSPHTNIKKRWSMRSEFFLANRGFRDIDYKTVCTYELKKVGLSYFYPKRKVCEHGIHTTPLDIKLFSLGLVINSALLYIYVLISQFTSQNLFPTNTIFEIHELEKNIHTYIELKNLQKPKKIENRLHQFIFSGLVFKHLKIFGFNTYKTSAKKIIIWKPFKFLDQTLENNTWAK